MRLPTSNLTTASDPNPAPHSAGHHALIPTWTCVTPGAMVAPNQQAHLLDITDEPLLAHRAPRHRLAADHNRPHPRRRVRGEHAPQQAELPRDGSPVGADPQPHSPLGARRVRGVVRQHGERVRALQGERPEAGRVAAGVIMAGGGLAHAAHVAFPALGAAAAPPPACPHSYEQPAAQATRMRAA